MKTRIWLISVPDVPCSGLWVEQLRDHGRLTNFADKLQAPFSTGVPLSTPPQRALDLSPLPRGKRFPTAPWMIEQATQQTPCTPLARFQGVSLTVHVKLRVMLISSGALTVPKHYRGSVPISTKASFTIHFFLK